MKPTDTHRRVITQSSLAEPINVNNEVMADEIGVTYTHWGNNEPYFKVGISGKAIKKNGQTGTQTRHREWDSRDLTGIPDWVLDYARDNNPNNVADAHPWPTGNTRQGTAPTIDNVFIRQLCIVHPAAWEQLKAWYRTRGLYLGPIPVGEDEPLTYHIVNYNPHDDKWQKNAGDTE